MSMMKIRIDSNSEAEDIQGMQQMPDRGYANWIDGDLFFMDHHENLRAVHGDYPIATTTAQVQMLVKFLQKVEARMKLAGR